MLARGVFVGLGLRTRGLAKPWSVGEFFVVANVVRDGDRSRCS